MSRNDDEEILDMAGREIVPMVRCQNCPWKRGCPDQCKRFEKAVPAGTAVTSNPRRQKGAGA